MEFTAQKEFAVSRELKPQVLAFRNILDAAVVEGGCPYLFTVHAAWLLLTNQSHDTLKGMF